LATRLIGQIYAELRLPHAAKQYALAVATLASQLVDCESRLGSGNGEHDEAQLRLGERGHA
jgi:hypothetical protein